jgi:hypothetical protein
MGGVGRLGSFLYPTPLKVDIIVRNSNGNFYYKMQNAGARWNSAPTRGNRYASIVHIGYLKKELALH